MNYLELSLEDSAHNLALDEALLLAAEDGSAGEVLRTWESTKPMVVLGASSVLAEDVDEAACLTDGVLILRRSSGGGTVLIGPGCLAYSLVLAYQSAEELRHIGASYCSIFDRLIKAIDVPGLSCAGTSDLAVGSFKVSGNSQQRKKNHLLHHGTILYSFDLSLVGRYLRMPGRKPEYRGNRGHAEFLSNLPLSKEKLVSALRGAFNATDGLKAWPIDRVRQLAASKYSQKVWTYRR